MTIIALVGTIDALVSGGRVISAGTAVIYGAFATAACWILAILTHGGAKRSNSPPVKADAKNWIVNGAVSTAVLLTFFWRIKKGVYYLLIILLKRCLIIKRKI